MAAWTKKTAPKSNRVKRAPYQRRRGLHRNREAKKRNGKKSHPTSFASSSAPSPYGDSNIPSGSIAVASAMIFA